MTTRLTIYNTALMHVGSRPLASLTENRPSRRALDAVWNNGFVDFVLEQGLWNFATRSAMVDYSPDITPGFGYQRAFDKPSDYIRTASVCVDERFQEPMTAYADEADYWFADEDTIYVKFVSNHASYGGDLTKWPESFRSYAELELAAMACKRITGSEGEAESIRGQAKRAKTEARSKDAANEPSKMFPEGSWLKSRRGGRSYRISPTLT